ncbi:33826_t:CDS:2, partial [Gigaspora margarita]
MPNETIEYCNEPFQNDDLKKKKKENVFNAKESILLSDLTQTICD